MDLIERVDPDRMRAHVEALAGFGSRDPRHPGHARAVAYLKEQLSAIEGVRIESHRAVYNAIPLENILVFIDPPGGAPAEGWVMICAHYDSIAVRTPGWRHALDPAPGADDNATGTAALLEYARILAPERHTLAQRVVIVFFDGEELFFKGSAAYYQSLPAPKPYAYVVNIDMVGWNPIADRLDLIWYGDASAGLRDRVKAANDRYAIGVSPLVEVFANDPVRYILDTAPWGLGGIPSVTLSERYGPPDATYPGNTFFHTTGDTPDKITNASLWLKAARLTLATALELARR
ncbi:MAG: M28 family metallopeptidase [Candidatus Limnocylindria bacterium]